MNEFFIDEYGIKRQYKPPKIEVIDLGGEKPTFIERMRKQKIISIDIDDLNLE